MADTVTLNITRFDPSTDDAPYVSSYEVPWEEYMTVLQAIQYINANEEVIAFDYSCRGGLCGRCSVMIDGMPGLACYTTIEPGTHDIAPLSGFPVIRDLTIDRSAFMRKLDDSVCAEISLADLSKPPAIDYDFYWETLDRIQKCRECGACVPLCPVLSTNSAQYAGPAVFSQIYLRANDKIDQGDRIMQAVEGGVFSCQLCGMCDQVCSAHIDHVAAHTWLRDEATKRGLVPTEDSTIEAI